MIDILDENKLFSVMNHYISSQLENKDLTWLKFIKKFKKQGKQGIAGALEINKNICVFKSSQYLNYIVQHEYTIMKDLNSLRHFCPHFCKTYGIVQNSVDGNYRKLDRPFDVTTKNPIVIETLLMEYISGEKFYSLIKNPKISSDVLFSVVKQVLMSLSIAQNHSKLAHYDLHSCNILMKECRKDDVFLYVLNRENQFCIPTHGYYPVIIDFGFSYSDSLKEQGICSPLAHTEVGFMSNQYDSIADVKLFFSNSFRRIKKI